MAEQENDLDETRRLLYMALLASSTKKYNLAGTLVNALRHHGQLAVNDAELEGDVLHLIEATANPALGSEKWARRLIAEITALLEADDAG